MNYPGIEIHLTQELEWIKNRYEYLFKKQMNQNTKPLARAEARKEMLSIDQERTEIYLKKINPTQ